MWLPDWGAQGTVGSVVKLLILKCRCWMCAKFKELHCGGLKDGLVVYRSPPLIYRVYVQNPQRNAQNLRWYWILHRVGCPYLRFLAHLCLVLVIHVVGGGDGRCRDIDIETERIFQTCFNHQNQPSSFTRHQSFIKAVHNTRCPILNSCLSFLLPAF